MSDTDHLAAHGGLGATRGRSPRVERPLQSTDDFVGRGWAFPLRVSPRGGVALSSGTDDIEEALALIISTSPGERVMRPDFGCALDELLFAPVDATTLGMIAHAVRRALSRWEPRIDVEDVDPVADPDHPERVLIQISYHVRATNDRRNLVHPFYVIPRDEHG